MFLENLSLNKMKEFKVFIEKDKSWIRGINEMFHMKLNRKEGNKNKFEIVRLDKIIINCVIGIKGKNLEFVKLIKKELKWITLQNPKEIKAKNSFSKFGIKRGDLIALKVTLRKWRMFNFLIKINDLVIPRIKEFKGYNQNNIDYYGNFNFGIKDISIFPELALGEGKYVNEGININMIFRNTNRLLTKELLSYYGFLFIKE